MLFYVCCKINVLIILLVFLHTKIHFWGGCGLSAPETFVAGFGVPDTRISDLILAFVSGMPMHRQIKATRRKNQQISCLVEPDIVELTVRRGQGGGGGYDRSG